MRAGRSRNRVVLVRANSISPFPMKVIAVIEPACADTADRRPAVVWQLLDHLRLRSAAPTFRVPPNKPREWSYELLFDLPVRLPAPPGR